MACGREEEECAAAQRVCEGGISWCIDMVRVRGLGRVEGA